MIELIERTLAKGGDLKQARETLLNQSKTEKLTRDATIEHDFRVATLINECLLFEPKGTAGYSVAKGVLHRIQEKYRDPKSEKIIRELMREARKETKADDKSEAEERRSPDNPRAAEPIV